MLFICTIDNVTCYCEFKNGGVEKNGIVCETFNITEKIGTCSPDEWCTGYPTPNYSTRLTSLCEKGRYKRIHNSIGIICIEQIDVITLRNTQMMNSYFQSRSHVVMILCLQVVIFAQCLMILHVVGVVITTMKSEIAENVSYL